MERQSKTFAIVGVLIIIFLVLVLVFRRPAPVEQPVDEPAVTEQIVTIENITVVIEQPEIEEQEKPMTDIPVEEEEDEKAIILALEIANQSLIKENREIRDDDIRVLERIFYLLREELGLPDYDLPEIPGTKVDEVCQKDEAYQIVELELRQKELLKEREELIEQKDFLLESIATMELELEI